MTIYKYIAHSDDPDFEQKMAAHRRGVIRDAADAEKAAEQQGIKERHEHSFGKGTFPYNDKGSNV